MSLLKATIRWIRETADKIISWRGTPYIILVSFSAVLLFPIYWTLNTSFKVSNEIKAWPPSFIPQSFTIENYVEALRFSPIGQNILNSLIYAGSATAFVVVIGVLTTYGFTIYDYKWDNKVAFGFLATRLIPPQALWLPFIIFYSRMGLANSRGGVVIFLIVLNYPLAVWMLRGTFEAFPKELIDSAKVDGASRLQTLLRVVLPVVAPGVGAVSIITFLWSWNEFMFPFLFLNSPGKYPVTVGIYHFIGDLGTKWGPLTASGMLIMLPGIIFFIFAQRYIVEGLAEGAVD